MRSVFFSSSESPLRAVVHYNCSSVSLVTFPPVEDITEVLEISVQSPCACPSSCQAEDVGPGNIILIMFAVSLISYFLFGEYSVIQTLIGDHMSPVREYGASSLRSMQTQEGSQITPEPRIWCGICCWPRRKQETLLTYSCREDDSIDV
ncbi:unnamed protein product [Ranitomeya imitator]|uniref:Uncharacterized protein n=1 Tax=Ranitomeya imitator TaxID=111125 RepID=A0ABN9KWP5_9NEOB|nr:unnamed protein product [Ranitomeya imitator]